MIEREGAKHHHFENLLNKSTSDPARIAEIIGGFTLMTLANNETRYVGLGAVTAIYGTLGPSIVALLAPRDRRNESKKP